MQPDRLISDEKTEICILDRVKRVDPCYKIYDVLIDYYHMEWSATWCNCQEYVVQ